MATVNDDIIMPDEILAGFPWKDQLHLWEYGAFRPELRLKIWNVAPADYDSSFREACATAWARHLEMWDWLAERYFMADVPEFETVATAWVKDDEQQYDRFAIYSTFHLGRRRTPGSA